MDSNTSQSDENGRRTEAARARTLLDITLEAALFDVLEALMGRVNRSSTLHQFATRAVFTGTAGLSNRELLQILIPTAAAEAGAFDSKQVRHWRSQGKERGQKLNTLRSHCLYLLHSRQVPNSEVVRGWAFAVIHAAALAAVHDTDDEHLAALRQGPDNASPEIVGATTARVRSVIATILLENNMVAQRSLAGGNTRALVDAFLHRAAKDLIAQMDNRGRHPTASAQFLLDIVYPAFDSYGDPMSLAHQTA